MKRAAPGTCNLPPKGWYCSLDAGHDGPCPTYSEDPWVPQEDDIAKHDLITLVGFSGYVRYAWQAFKERFRR